MDYIYHSPPHLSGREQEFINDALVKNWVAPVGPHINTFESKLSAYVGAVGAVATCSGTAALHLALRLLGIGARDIVFCSSLTWIASIAPAIYLGAEPVFIDSEPSTWNMSPIALQRAFEDGQNKARLPKAVIVVHLFGQSANMEPILDLCNVFKVPVIEDSAQSLGATYLGKHCGTMGYFGIYSFNGNKIITTSSGGALVSHDETAISRARYLAGHARLPVRHHEHSEIGYNYRMSNICAAIGLAQIQVIDERIAARRAIYAEYCRRLNDLPGVVFMPEFPPCHSTHWMTTLTLDKDVSPVTNIELMDALSVANIEPRPIWMPQHLQPVMRGYKFYPHVEGEDVSAQLFHTGLCLPSGSSLTQQGIDRVVTCIRQRFAHDQVT